MARTVALWITLLNVLPLACTQREAAPAAAVETEPAAELAADDGSVLPFPPEKSGSIAKRTLQDSTYSPRPAPPSG
jgi:hypothetical protein